jgi:hypothetical protein
MPHSQARNGIKFTKGLQLLNTLMSAGCDIRCCNEKINRRRPRVVHERFSQVDSMSICTDVLTGAPDRVAYAYMRAVGAVG